MVRSIDRAELLRLIEHEDAHIVDVLPRREYEESHLPGAHSIPLRNLTSETVAGLPRDEPIVVYCHDGL
jgi:rhodanese-related sulfurtransferase